MVLEVKRAKKVVLIAGLLLIVIVAVSFFGGGKSCKQPIDVADNTTGEMAQPGQGVLEKGWRDEANFFAEYRLQRERMRSREMQVLKELACDKEQGQATRDAASSKIMYIMEETEKEMKAENLVKSRGVEECVIISEPGISTVVIEGSAAVIDEEEIRNLVSHVLKVSEEDLSMVFRSVKIE